MSGGRHPVFFAPIVSPKVLTRRAYLTYLYVMANDNTSGTIRIMRHLRMLDKTPDGFPGMNAKLPKLAADASVTEAKRTRLLVGEFFVGERVEGHSTACQDGRQFSKKELDEMAFERWLTRQG